ncbi:Zinc finger, CCHC-type [Sesbania bispinosa]|nr:Zinc finger, CCHC-type [Sesbania bispinosa]
MYSNFTPTEFDEFWKKKVVEHGLEGNKWVLKTYENKELWATAYLRDKFFGRIRTTSQCESINSFLRSYCKKKSSMVEFLHKFEQVKKEYRNNELMAEFKTLFSEPVLSTYLRSIEKEASNIYTQEIFREVKQEIEKTNALMVCERSMLDDNVMFSLKKFCSPASKKRNHLKEILEDIRKLTIKYEKLEDKVCKDGNPTVEVVGDLVTVKTKGAPRKKKNNKKRRIHCSNCSSTGHTIRRCPLRYNTNDDSKNDKDLSHSESSGDIAANDIEKDAMDSGEGNGKESNADETKDEDETRQERDRPEKKSV